MGDCGLTGLGFATAIPVVMAAGAFPLMALLAGSAPLLAEIGFVPMGPALANPGARPTGAVVAAARDVGAAAADGALLS